MVVSAQAQKARVETDAMEADDEDADFFQDVEQLQNHGINMADIKKLQSVGICTVKGVMMTTKKRLAEIKGLSEAKVDKIKEAACKILGSDTRLCCTWLYLENCRDKLIFEMISW
ncbi:hypothetical protein ANCCAN_06191 [Ancylostoma caninum]|uniref:DNA recombination and repair protein Rad51-like C-terminal domain-containing protein n=1 Tax=Ancylostoma caninum TaxID=29170 RepID=A0A368GXJ7_ANCCA|nr:hypothetical protein ANCCAN_06191 [Ancylostoma caninum]